MHGKGEQKEEKEDKILVLPGSGSVLILNLQGSLETLCSMDFNSGVVLQPLHDNQKLLRKSKASTKRYGMT